MRKGPIIISSAVKPYMAIYMQKYSAIGGITIKTPVKNVIRKLVTEKHKSI
jgi:hypothetical protein